MKEDNPKFVVVCLLLFFVKCLLTKPFCSIPEVPNSLYENVFANSKKNFDIVYMPNACVQSTTTMKVKSSGA
jgi:hypothetical protein